MKQCSLLPVRHAGDEVSFEQNLKCSHRAYSKETHTKEWKQRWSRGRKPETLFLETGAKPECSLIPCQPHHLPIVFSRFVGCLLRCVLPFGQASQHGSQFPNPTRDQTCTLYQCRGPLASRKPRLLLFIYPWLCKAFAFNEVTFVYFCFYFHNFSR